MPAKRSKLLGSEVLKEKVVLGGNFLRVKTSSDSQAVAPSDAPIMGGVSLPILDLPTDRLGRGIDDLRISVIDRCNYRCTFCMPADREYHFLPRHQLLTFEEIVRLTRVFAGLGVRKIRLTGGEPLLRSDIERLVEMLAAVDGIEDLALTTNGRLLAQKAQALADAGLGRVTVSLESLDDEIYGKINGLQHPVAPVLEGIEAAAEAGLGPIKINTVVMKGTNDHEIVPLARFFKERGHIVRFIEFMDVGTLNGWDLDAVVSAREIAERLDAELPLEPLERARSSDVAERFRYRDDGLEVGIVASITQPFCGDCSRARLTSDGALYTCLFGASGLDLRAPLRDGVDDREIEDRVRAVWRARADRYSEERARALAQGGKAPVSRIEMFRIGG